MRVIKRMLEISSSTIELPTVQFLKNAIGRIVGAKIKFMGTGTVNGFEFRGAE